MLSYRDASGYLVYRIITQYNIHMIMCECACMYAYMYVKKYNITKLMELTSLTTQDYKTSVECIQRKILAKLTMNRKD